MKEQTLVDLNRLVKDQLVEKSLCSKVKGGLPGNGVIIPPFVDPAP